jgi:choline-sulfatase
VIAGLRRAAAALAGALWVALAVGLATALTAPTGHGWALGWRSAALLVLPGLAVGLWLAVAALALTGGLRARGRALVAEHPQAVGAVALVVPPAAVLWLGVTTSLGRFFFTAFHHVGLAVMAQGVTLLGLTLGFVTLTALVVARARRALSSDGQSLRRALWTPLAAGLALAVALFAHGVFWGNEHGTFTLRAFLLSPLGVLKKPELDLTPALQLAAIAGFGALVAVAVRRVAWAALPVALALAGGSVYAAATRFGDHEVAATLDARPSLVRTSLRLLRARTDRDHDGFARHFGGGDCNDDDPAINPDAVDRGGNGVDEDCSGSDARARPAAPVAAPSDAGVAPVDAAGTVGAETADAGMAPLPDAAGAGGGYNLVFITVDTLRWDLHYAGNPNPITPNLDRLAAQSVVFERGYALSSYTGRAIGPMMAGRYPTECPRDAQHFTRYLPGNVMLAERAKDAGFRTFGAASHFYFERRFGLAQGVDAWDTSAIPGGDTQETSYNDHRVADRALAMLRDPETTRGRFMLWAHFFDPHKLYVDHPDLPLFGRGERARYEREVMFTDAQIGRLLDALDALPGDVGQRTLVVVTADHGEAFGEHGMSWHGVELWDELVRVPWIMRVPGIAPRRVTEPRGHIDLAPTLVELLGLPRPAPDAPDAFSGVSLVPDLRGLPAPPRPIYIELPEGPYNSLRRAVVDGTWKLTERGARRFELYNLADDPGERTNLAATRPDDLARLREVMDSLRGGLRTVAPVTR